MQSSTAPTSPTPPKKQSAGQNWLLRLLLGFFCLFVTAYLGIAGFTANSLTTPGHRKLPNTPQTYNTAYENITFTARIDQTRISAWFLPAQASKKAIIFVHGKGQCRACEFSGVSTQLGVALAQRGLNVLMLDLRGHGESGDGRFTFGLRERRDVEGAVDWLEKRGFKPGQLGLLGVSMGSATSIGTTADEPAIGALVADSSYADFSSILEKEFPAASGLPSFFLPPALLISTFLTGENIQNARPIDEIGKIAPRPILIIHAKDDGLIPLEHAKRLYAAAGSNAELWIIPGKKHVDTFPYDQKAYADRVAKFFEEKLAK